MTLSCASGLFELKGCKAPIGLKVLPLDNLMIVIKELTQLMT